MSPSPRARGEGRGEGQRFADTVLKHLAFIVALSFAAAAAAAADLADLVLVNGKIVTVDARFSIAQAIAIKGERIVAVGTSADVRKAAAPNAREIDLGGRTV